MTQPMEVGKAIIRHLRAQEGHYLSIKQAVEKQTGFITAMDTGRLTSGTTEVRGLMRKVRDLELTLRPLRQSWATMGIDRSMTEQREIESQIASIRGLIGAIQEAKERNTSLLVGSMDKVRGQMVGLNSRSSAARAYHSEKPQAAARFIDKSN